MDVESRMNLTENEIRIQIGDVCCSFVCHNTGILGNLKQLFHGFLSTNRADTIIELEDSNQLSLEETEAAMAEAKYIHEGGKFYTHNHLIIGEHDATGRNIRFKAERHLLNPDSEQNAINRLLSISYYTACKARYDGDPPAMLVHASGIVRKDRSMIFSGPCEIGKTTIARMCAEPYGQVINDEILLVSRLHSNNGGMVKVCSSPHIGELKPQVSAAAPLSCVLMLKQGHRTSVRRLQDMEAYVRFMRQIITPAYIGQSNPKAIYSLIADFSKEIIEVVPFYELEFTLNRQTLWSVLEELEESLGSRSG